MKYLQPYSVECRWEKNGVEIKLKYSKLLMLYMKVKIIIKVRF